MLENLVEYYRKSDDETKKKINGCIFSEKLVLEKGKVATTLFTVPIQVILNAREGLRTFKKKKEVENDLLSRLVPRTDKSCNQLKDLLTVNMPD